MNTLIICDDEQSIAEDLQSRISSILSEEWDIQFFCSPDTFRDYMRGAKTLPDILFMDIQFGVENGIELAYEIQSRCPWTAVVLITGYINFANDIFTIRPAYFLVKPIDDDKLAASVERALEYLNSCRDTAVTLQSNGNIFTLRSSEIYYVESEKRRLHIHTTAERYTVYMKLNEIKEQLPDCFLSCHKSYLVNLNYIHTLSSQKITLVNSAEIPVSRSRYKKFKEDFMHFFSMENRRQQRRF